MNIVQALVNLSAFRLGGGVVVFFDHWTDEFGNESGISLNDPALSSLCTAFRGQPKNFLSVMNVIFAEPPLFMALNDLILSLTLPNHAPINCARSVEAIRQMIAAQGMNRAKAWPIMRSMLNLDQSYIQLITDSSTKHRHGNYVHISGNIVQEITKRSWVIMDRFLHFRLRKNKKLPIRKFPLLIG